MKEYPSIMDSGNKKTYTITIVDGFVFESTNPPPRRLHRIAMRLLLGWKFEIKDG